MIDELWRLVTQFYYEFQLAFQIIVALFIYDRFLKRHD